jgi:hypothetical protein
MEVTFIINGTVVIQKHVSCHYGYVTRKHKMSITHVTNFMHYNIRNLQLTSKHSPLPKTYSENADTMSSCLF